MCVAILPDSTYLSKILPWGWGCNSVMQHLPGKCEAKSSIPSTRERKKEEREKKK